MKKLQLSEEILLSWRRCIESNISLDAMPVYPENGKYADLLKKHSQLISTFEQVTCCLKQLSGISYLFLY